MFPPLSKLVGKLRPNVVVLVLTPAPRKRSTEGRQISISARIRISTDDEAGEQGESEGSRTAAITKIIIMTDYNLIFGVVLVINVLATFRASSYWKKYFPTSGGGSVVVDDDEPTPLVSVGDDDENDDVKRNRTEDDDNDREAGGGGSSSKPSDAASDAAASIRHAQLLRKYLAVYLFAAMSDWLQGPYVYALYDAYGYSQHDIAVLFVAGFGSSMVFGSFVGGMADQGGRKKFVVLFAIIYSLSCMTKRECYYIPFPSPPFDLACGNFAPFPLRTPSHRPSSLFSFFFSRLAFPLLLISRSIVSVASPSTPPVIMIPNGNVNNHEKQLSTFLRGS